MKNTFLNRESAQQPGNIGHRQLAVGLLAAASLIGLTACNSPAGVDTAAEESNVTAEELADNADGRVGEEVTIRSTVEETVDESSFLLNDDDYFDGEGILVVNATGEPFVVPDVGDSEVQVTGKVETFATTTVAESYGLTLDPDLYEEYETKPVIIAESIALAPDPGEITANPETFYNQRIAVEGEVEDLREVGLFTVDDEALFGGENLLVYAPGVSAPVQEGETVALTGVLRPFVAADFEKDYDLQWDLSVKEEIEATYETKPVFVADRVYPSAI